jgi:hypothetical protein
MIVWALFDSGNGCYKKTANQIGIEIYSIGLDRENKNEHFINLNLADYSRIFGDNKLFDELDKLPQPDLIIASPPCESWSVASAMNGGNACWKTDQIENLFGEMKGSMFTIREHKDFDKYQFYPDRQLMTRINGELCIFNTIEIIRKYKPKYWVIENPAFGKIWEYIEKILGFEIPYHNQTYYSAYGYDVQKPTRFASNVDLKLKTEKIKNKIPFNQTCGYNNRSNIPEKLVEEVFNKIKEEYE